jgi:hypothetical protein
MGRGCRLSLKETKEKPMNNDKEKDLKAVKVTITYYGVGKTIKQATADAWNSISNDNNFQMAIVDEKEMDVEEGNWDPYFLESLTEDDE